MERAWTAQALPRFGDNRYLGTYIPKYLQRHRYIFSPGNGTYRKHSDFPELLLSFVRAPDNIKDVEYGRRGKMALSFFCGHF
jgi:hypothetical protein